MSNKTFSRRAFLSRSALAVGGLALGPALFRLPARMPAKWANADTIPVGNLQDLTGDLNIYGIQQSEATQMAVDDINANGGVLGKQLQLIKFDTQSSLDRYTEYANTLISQYQVAVVFAGLTSSSREAIRPIMDKNNQIYFYCALYEGGVCDKNVFIPSVSGSQQIQTMMKYAIDNIGKNFYIVGPDYNFGTISGQWVKVYADRFGGKVLGEDYLPLSETNFGTTITKLQSAKPDAVVWLPVGSNQTSFAAQFAAAGLKGKMVLISTNYGAGNQQVVVPPAAGEGILVVTNYVQEVDNPTNKKWVADWQKRFGDKEPIISEANDAWVGWHLWAMGVNKAGSLDHDAVIKALESGLKFDAPEGPVSLDPATHHCIHTIYVVKGNANHGFDIVKSYPNSVPDYEQQVCDLIKNPDTAEQFTPETAPLGTATPGK